MKRTILATAVLAMAGWSGSASADVIIDFFNSPVGGQVVSNSTNGTTATNQAGPGLANVIGGYRDLSLELTQQLFGGTSTLSANQGNSGVLSLDNASGNRSVGVVTWDGANNAGNGGASVNTTGLASADLTVGNANAFLARVLAADLGFDYSITVWDMDGDKSVLSAAVQFQVQSPVFDDASYFFSWFNLANGTYCDGVAAASCADPINQLFFTINHTGGAIDFSRIGAIQLSLTNTSVDSVDLTLGTIRTVPEPSALALVGLGLLGAGVARRRSQTKT